MAERQLKTPVAFIIFNRPDFTARAFAQIARARPSKLLVVADGPRPDYPGEAAKCEAARGIVEAVDWPCEVMTNFAPSNLGCGKRVSSGLRWVFDSVEEAIILEDDCVPHQSFFPFCEELLSRYREDERVMMIAGTNYLERLDIPESYLFSRYFAVWGWATWKRAWEKYDFDMADWEVLREQNQVDSFYRQAYAAKHVTKMFDLVYHHRIDTWDIQWFYSCLFNHGLSVVPRVNLISNIGGAVGTHVVGGTSEPLPVFALETESLRHPKRVFASSVHDNALYERRIRTSALGLLKRKAHSLGHRILPGKP